MTTQAESTTVPTRRRGRRTDKNAESNQGPSGRSGPETVTTTGKPKVVPIKKEIPATPLTPAQKAAATRAAKAQAIKEQSEALAAELEKAKQKAAPKEPRVTGHRMWATKEIPGAMLRFTKWINREFPEFGGDVDPRVVMVASKAYRYFQNSDLNP
jgi:hypothetical protein